MYQVSADYLTAIAKNARAHKIKGTVGGVNFTGEDVIRKTFQVRNQFCQSTTVEIGGVYVGELDLTFSTAFANAMDIRGTWMGVGITAQIGVELANSTYEYIPMGVYTIAEAKWTTAGLEITAYDNMTKFDKPFSNLQSSGKLYDWLTFACSHCGVNLAMTQSDCEDLPNGTETLSMYPDESIETYRDMISELAAACCCFATMNRNGELELRLMNHGHAGSNSASERYSTSFSDYASYYDSISVVDMKTEKTLVYTNGNPDGLTMNLGSNPFLQYGSDMVVTRIRMQTAMGLRDFRATPFSISILPNPALDLGDMMGFVGGIASAEIGCIMSFVHRVDSTVIEGYGDNPALASARSKVDKDISGLIGKTSENEMIIYTYENVSVYNLEDEEEEDVIEIRFATITPKIVQILHELKLNVEAVDPTKPIKCKVHYYLNGDEVAYHPETSWDNDGYHLLHLMYFLITLEDNEMYDWKVALELENGTAEIDRGDIRAALLGQGLVATDEWAGLVPISDPTYVLTLGGDLTYNYVDAITEQDYRQTDDPDWDGEHTYAPLDPIVDASFVLTLGGELRYNYTESRVKVDTNMPSYTRISESGDTRVTESGDKRITEGE